MCSLAIGKPKAQDSSQMFENYTQLHESNKKPKKKKKSQDFKLVERKYNMPEFMRQCEAGLGSASAAGSADTGKESGL